MQCLIYTGDEDGYIRIYNIFGAFIDVIPHYPPEGASREVLERHHHEVHSGEVNCLKFLSPTEILSGGDDGAVKLWDVTTGALLATYTPEPVPQKRSFSGNPPSSMATQSNLPKEKMPQIGDVSATKRALASEQGGSLGTAQQGAKKPTVPVPIIATKRSVMKKLNSRRKLRRGVAFLTPVVALSFDTEKNIILAGFDHGIVAAFDKASGAQLYYSECHESEPISGLIAINQEDVFVSTAEDDTLHLSWTKTGKEILGYRFSTACITYDPIRNLLLCATWEGKICICKLISTLGRMGEQETEKEFKVLKKVPVVTPKAEEMKRDDKVVLNIQYDTVTDTAVVCLFTNEIVIVQNITQISYTAALQQCNQEKNQLQFMDDPQINSLFYEIKMIAGSDGKDDGTTTTFDVMKDFIKNCIKSIQLPMTATNTPELLSQSSRRSLDLSASAPPRGMHRSIGSLSSGLNSSADGSAHQDDSRNAQITNALKSILKLQKSKYFDSLTNSKALFQDEVKSIYSKFSQIVDQKPDMTPFQAQHDEEKRLLLERHRRELEELDMKYQTKFMNFKKSFPLDRQRLAKKFRQMLEEEEKKEADFDQKLQERIILKVEEMLPVICNKYVLGNRYYRDSRTTYRGVRVPEVDASGNIISTPTCVVIKVFQRTGHSPLRTDLVHPRIVPVLDTCKTKTAIYVITKEVPSDLYQFIDAHTVIDHELIADLAYYLFETLGFLHRNNLVFRNLSPSTVLLDTDDLTEVSCVKLKHFGVMKALSGEEKCERGVIYSAPELFGSSVAASSDSWSMGCILVHLFQTREERANCPIVSGKTPEEILTSMCKFFGNITTNFLNNVVQWCKIGDKKDLYNSVFGELHDKPNVPMENSKEVVEYTAKILHDNYCRNAPPEALNLIAQLLRFSPRARLSCIKALRHPFFVKYCSIDSARESLQLQRFLLMSSKKAKKKTAEKKQDTNARRKRQLSPTASVRTTVEDNSVDEVRPRRSLSNASLGLLVYLNFIIILFLLVFLNNIFKKRYLFYCCFNRVCYNGASSNTT